MIQILELLRPNEHYWYLPIIISQVNSIHLANFRFNRRDHRAAHPISTLLFYLPSIYFAFTKRKRGPKSTRIKPGVKYAYDEATGQWAPANPISDSTNGVFTQPAVNPQSAIPNPKFKLIWPLDLGFVVTQTFQQHQQTKIKNRYKYYNPGLDLAFFDVREGADVRAAADGVLKSAYYNGSGYGNLVTIDHLNGYLTLYAHLSGFAAFMKGQIINAGEIIGYLGHTGNCWGGPGNPEGTHLHFELRYLNSPVDPIPYLR